MKMFPFDPSYSTTHQGYIHFVLKVNVMSSQDDQSSASSVLSPLTRGLGYALAQGDQEVVEDLLLRVQEEESPNVCAYFAEAQIAYGKRQWARLALALRYAFCYGVKDEWVSGVLAALYQYCDCFEYSEFIFKQGQAKEIDLFLQLDTQERQELKYALLKSLVPAHNRSKKQHVEADHKQETPTGSLALPPTFQAFQSSLPYNQDPPTWLSDQKSSLTIPTTQYSEAISPNWLENQQPGGCVCPVNWLIARQMTTNLPNYFWLRVIRPAGPQNRHVTVKPKLYCRYEARF